MATITQTTDGSGNFVMTVTVPPTLYTALCNALGVTDGQLAQTLMSNAQSTLAAYQQSLVQAGVRSAIAKGNGAAVVAAFQTGGALANLV